MNRDDSEANRLASDLRELRLAEPHPDLRRRTLQAAREVLQAEQNPQRSWALGFRELGLAAAGLLAVFFLTPTPGATQPATAYFTKAELVEALGVEEQLAEYLNQRSVPAAGTAPASLSPTNNDPS